MRYIPVAFFVLLAAVGLAVLGLRSAKATTVSPATKLDDPHRRAQTLSRSSQRGRASLVPVDRQRDARVPNLLERRCERAARGD